MKYIMWKQQDGTEIAVKDMPDEHLFNTIKMLEQTAKSKLVDAKKKDRENPVFNIADFEHHKLRQFRLIARARGIDV